MNSTLKKTLIILLIILACIVVYKYLIVPNINSDGSSLSSLNSDGTTSGVSQVSQGNPEDTAFLSTLLGLTEIKVDATLFSSPSFKSLQDNFVPIIHDGIVGRENPFAPIDPQTETVEIVDPVTTLDATQITTTSVLLSGVLAPNTQVKSKSFQWGKSETFLEKEIAVVGDSLVGTFSKTLTGLSPKTTYYFRAKAIIGTTTSTGTIISFTTN